MFRSKITSKIKTNLLLRYFFFGALAVALLVLLSDYPTLNTYERFGLSSLALFMIFWGYLPYKNTLKLELNPYRLTLNDGMISLFRNHQCLASFLTEDISSVFFVNRRTIFGIGLVFSCKHVDFKKVKTMRHGALTKTFDLFLPFFDQKVFSALKTFQNSSHGSHHASAKVRQASARR